MSLAPYPRDLLGYGDAFAERWSSADGATSSSVHYRRSDTPRRIA